MRVGIRDIGATTIYRLIQLALAFAVNTFTIRLLTDEHGVSGYALYALIGSFLGLLPFADLGLGIGLVNATTDVRAKKLNIADYKSVVTRTRRILLVVSAALILVDIALLTTGTWGAILGVVTTDKGAEFASAATLAAIAITLPFGIGSRILQGMGLMRTVALLGIAQPFVQAAGILTCWWLDAPSYMFALVPAITFTASGIIIYSVASWRMRSIPGFSTTVTSSEKTYPHKIAASAAPFLIITLSTTLAFQTARLILTQSGTVEDLAQYSFVAQYYVPLFSLISVAAQNLWPTYRLALVHGSMGLRHLVRHVAVFAAVGVAAAIGLIALVLAVQQWIVSEPLLNWNVLVAACVFLVIMSTHQPSAMLLSDPIGLRKQAIIVAVMSIANVLLTIALVPILAAAAPYWSSAICVGGIVLIPTFIIAARRLRPNAPSRNS